MALDLPAITSMLTADEGKRLTVYDDATGLPIGPGSVVKGHPTIGVGRALDTHGISDAEVQMLLASDISSVAADLGAFAWFKPLDPVRQAALVAMAFQLGTAGLLHFPHMLAAIVDGNWKAAAAEAQTSLWAVQTPARAKQVEGMFLTGEMPA